MLSAEIDCSFKKRFFILVPSVLVYTEFTVIKQSFPKCMYRIILTISVTHLGRIRLNVKIQTSKDGSVVFTCFTHKIEVTYSYFINTKSHIYTMQVVQQSISRKYRIYYLKICFSFL